MVQHNFSAPHSTLSLTLTSSAVCVAHLIFECTMNTNERTISYWHCFQFYCYVEYIYCNVYPFQQAHIFHSFFLSNSNPKSSCLRDTQRQRHNFCLWTQSFVLSKNVQHTTDTHRNRTDSFRCDIVVVVIAHAPVECTTLHTDGSTTMLSLSPLQTGCRLPIHFN